MNSRRPPLGLALDAQPFNALTSRNVHPARLREVIAASWLRSAAAGVDPDGDRAPIALSGQELTSHQASHPLHEVLTLVRGALGRAAEDGHAMMAVGDAAGRLLWVSGPSLVMRRAERIHFVEGAIWDERVAGTNAPGMALRLDASVIVHTAEHYNRGARAWSCAAAPVHDPRTGAVLGVIDLTGGSDVASRQALSLIHATARLAEAELARLHASRRPPPTHDSGPPPSPGGLRVDGLGLPGCAVQIGDRTLRLSPRHSEIIVILADHPAGLTGDELAVELYHADAPTSTIRAELARLRALLGAESMGSRPYLLRAQPECDWLAVTAYLAAGRVREAVRAYRGPLLPRSDAPGVVTRRMRLERELRAAVLASGDTDLLVSWTRTPWGADDLPVWERQVSALPGRSPLANMARAEARHLHHEFAADATGGGATPLPAASEAIS